MNFNIFNQQHAEKGDFDDAEQEGISCMCGCHVLEDPVNAGMRCDFCGCIAMMHKLMRESGQLPSRRERADRARLAKYDQERAEKEMNREDGNPL
jgi:hypothetical protein